MCFLSTHVFDGELFVAPSEVLADRFGDLEKLQTVQVTEERMNNEIDVG